MSFLAVQKNLRYLESQLRRGLAFGLGASLPKDAAYRQLVRTLLLASVVGAAAGGVSGLFALALIHVQHWVLDGFAGVTPLHAAGEHDLARLATPFRPWLMVFLPALGAGFGSFLAYRFAPETAGGGGDSAIRVFHRQDAIARRRVPLMKCIVSVLTIGFGGSGGQEGPTVQIGSATGSLVARWLRTTARERRILYVAGIAAGIAAVFRTPLGAALFAVEVLYRDDFESDALIPAVFASVSGYSLSLLFGAPSDLFAHAESYPFVPMHLPLFGLLALLEVGLGMMYLQAMRRVRRVSEGLKGPLWLRPCLGGLALGLLATPVVYLLSGYLGEPGSGLGMFGGGFGIAQVAITGAPFLPGGWDAVWILGALCLTKVAATSLTLGTRGSAGNLAPTLVIGGLLGGAFGRAASLFTGDSRIDPGAFALVGMGTLFGGIGHVPLSSMILVCEMAGSYDLILPLMLAEGIAFVALRHHHLFPSQPARREDVADELRRRPSPRVREVAEEVPEARHFGPATRGRAMLEAAGDVPAQVTFPVLDEAGALVGLVPAGALRVLAGEGGMAEWIVATDLMQEPVTARPDESAAEALARMAAAGLRQIPVLGDAAQIVGYLDERAVVGRLVQGGALEGAPSERGY